jgi:hypothetical protein
LKVWLDEHNVDQVWLSYFGEGRPDYYGINYTGLDSWPPRLMDPEARPFYPHDPAPGIYAISATTLQGVHFANHDQFAWFREREPLDKVGYSIFLYEVPPRGEPTDVVLAGVQLDEIAPDDFARFGTNQVLPRWLNSSSAFIQPAAEEFWLVAENNFEMGWLDTAVSLQHVTENQQYTFYHAVSAQSGMQPGWSFRQNELEINLLDLPEGLSLVEGELQFITRWRNDTGPVPIKIYVHLVDESGQIVAQWDGLDIAWEGWRAGDVLWQHHEVMLPAIPSVQYELRLGVYDPSTGDRWLTASGADGLLLDTLVIDP